MGRGIATISHRTHNGGRLTFAHQKRVQRIKQRPMMNFERRCGLSHWKRLWRHSKGKMSDNRADRMLVPVVDVKRRTAVAFQHRQLREVNLIGCRVAAGGFGWSDRFSAVGDRGQAESCRDHPQQEMRPEISSSKLSPARQYTAHLPCHPE